MTAAEDFLTLNVSRSQLDGAHKLVRKEKSIKLIAKAQAVFIEILKCYWC